MERFTISKSEKQTIYEIYRACRICGAGGGYRMPIIQTIIDLDSSEVELRQKIQECLQLEVRPDDRMPPLICELCVDKLNDFHKFLELSRQTNIRTRTRLGLPIQDVKKGDPEPSNCILGVTEPVYVKDNEPAKKNKAGPKCSKIKREPDVVNVKIESDSSRSSSVSSRASRSRRAPSPSPAPAPRRRSLLEDALSKRTDRPEDRRTNKPEGRRTSRPEEISRKTLSKETPKKTEIAKKETGKKETPKETQPSKDKKAPPAKKKGELEYLLEDSLKFSAGEPTSPLAPRTYKRQRQERPVLHATRSKPIPTKELLKEPSPPRRPAPKSKQEPIDRPGPRSKKPRLDEEHIPTPVKVPKSKAKPETPKPKEPPRPPEESPPAPPYKCAVCDFSAKNAGALGRHLTIHNATFTKLTHACNPCGQWFESTEEAATHHRFHGAATFPYHCRRCFDDFKTLQLYDEHLEKGLCVGDEPSLKCEDCLALFGSEALRGAHKCPGRGPQARPGGKCSKCSRTYATAKTLKKHESQCSQKKKGGDLIADPDVLRRLKPMQVRITKCDGLLARCESEHYDVSRVKPNYGLAKNYIYPYMKLPPVKSEPLYKDSMVAIPVALKEEFSFTHWDSDDSDIEAVNATVPSLSTLAIKKLFSKNLLGKVPRKRKRVKNEAFENENETEFSVSNNINDIINSLDDMGNSSLDSKDFNAKIKDIIGCLDDSEMGESVDEVSNAVNQSETREIEAIEDRTANESHCETGETIDANENDKTADENQEVADTVLDTDRSKMDVESNENDESTKDTLESDKSDNCEQFSNVEDNLGVESLDTTSETVDANENDKTADENQEVANTVLDTDSSKMDIETNENDESTKDNVESNKSDNCEQFSNVEDNLGVESLDTVLESNQINDVGNENETINRLDSENENSADFNDKENDLGAQSMILNDELCKLVSGNVPVNGSNVHQNENSVQDESIGNITSVENDSTVDVDEFKKTEELSKQINKESPIKHSIENLIGEADKNPDKYINEVISSIEDIIMNNPRNDELNRSDHEQINGQNDNINDNLMDVLDDEIGDKRISDHDKITLEDLLPKENRQEELENISDDDFNFDT